MGQEREEPLEIEGLDVEEIEVEAGEDLESAMQEALEAVEASERRSTEAEVDEPLAGEPEVEPAVGEALEDENSLGELAVLRREVVELRDRSVRTLADFDNYRKRVERERVERERYAGADILRDALDVVDNLERALQADGEFEDLKAGVELILKQVIELLRRYGVERVEAKGEAFDPSLHEAVSRQEDETISMPMVDEELQSGYLMKDRLLRPAMVTVAVPVSQEPTNGETD